MFDQSLLPNFLVIGAAKSGTTALYHYIEQHPDAFMSAVKEPKFFVFDGQSVPFGGPGARIFNNAAVQDLGAYQALFEDGREALVRGEASTYYLYHPLAAATIRKYVPNMKMVAVLRDPIDRAFSGYVMHAMRGQEKITFEEAIADEPRRIRENWIWGRYMDVGRYAAQLKRYWALFPKDQLRIYLYDDLQADSLSVVQDVYHFLKLDTAFAPNVSVRHNVSGLPKNRWLDSLVGKRPSRYWLRAFKPLIPNAVWRLRDKLRKQNMEKPTLDPALRQKLLNKVRDDVLELQDLIERDLSHWLR